MKKIFEQLPIQYKLPAQLFKDYAFEVKNDKIFIMTKPAKEFDKIKAIRKGLIFAIKKRKNFIIKEDVLKRLLRNYQ
ncbi:MAG: hypothetical protein N2748_04065 [candidate division WOR-3 bacterium]|nr:hypothetical protein [candidate division WOR-3 bacterium]